MHSPGRPGRLRRLITTAAVTATVLLGTPVAAHAQASTGSSASGGKASFTAACGAAKEHHFT